MARPATESLFLSHYTPDHLPWLWILVGAGNMAVVTVYNRFSATTDLVTIFGAVSAISASILALLLLGLSTDAPWLTWVLYVWKDLYIVVLIEIFWSHSPTAQCLGIGRSGGTASSAYSARSVVWRATSVSAGSLKPRPPQSSLWAVVILLTLSGIGAWTLARSTGITGASDKPKRSLMDGFHVLKSSRFLLAPDGADWNLAGGDHAHRLSIHHRGSRELHR